MASLSQRSPSARSASFMSKIASQTSSNVMSCAKEFAASFSPLTGLMRSRRSVMEIVVLSENSWESVTKKLLTILSWSSSRRGTWTTRTRANLDFPKGSWCKKYSALQHFHLKNWSRAVYCQKVDSSIFYIWVVRKGRGKKNCTSIISSRWTNRILNRLSRTSLCKGAFLSGDVLTTMAHVCVPDRKPGSVARCHLYAISGVSKVWMSFNDRDGCMDVMVALIMVEGQRLETKLRFLF